jgi:alpha-mannosidase
VAVQVLDTYRGYERLDSPDDYPLQHAVAAFRVAAYVEGASPLGIEPLRVKHAGATDSVADRVWVSGKSLASGWCSIRVDRDGGFAITDTESDRRFQSAGQLVSDRDCGDAYTFQPEPTPKPDAARWGSARAVWRGPLVAAIGRDFQVGRRVRGTVYARLDCGSRLVRFAVEGQNLAGNHRLRIIFPLPPGTAPRSSVARMHYGPVERLQQTYDMEKYPSEWPVPTAPMHEWVSVEDGLTVFARGLYEYEITADGRLAVTLFRAVGDLSRDDLTARPGHAAWPTATPEAQERGPFRAELAVATKGLGVGPSSATHDELEQWADEFHAPLAGLMLSHASQVPTTIDGPRLDGDGLAFQALKVAERSNMLVLRCANVSDRETSGTWTLPWPVRAAHRARLDETLLEPLLVSKHQRVVSVSVRPREIVTVLVEPSS